VNDETNLGGGRGASSAAAEDVEGEGEGARPSTVSDCMLAVTL